MSSILKNISVAEAIACFARIAPVTPRQAALTEAIGLRLATDVVTRRPLPLEPIAARNGYAVAASSTAGATPRRPRLIRPEPRPVDTGAIMPPGADAVLPFVQSMRLPKGPAALRTVTPGEGVAAPESIAPAGELILRAGTRLTFAAAMACAACGVTDVLVRRPVVDIIFNAPSLAEPGEQPVGLICAAIRGSGCQIGSLSFAGGDAATLRDALLASSADIITVVGGVGDGLGDTTMPVIAEIGEAVFHGVRMTPGRAMGFGFVQGKPVFASPGRLPDMIAANIVLSWHFARRAFGRPPMEPQLVRAPLAAAVPASPDCARLILARFENGAVQPIPEEQPTARDIARANVSLFAPEGTRRLPKGKLVSVLRMSVTM